MAIVAVGGLVAEVGCDVKLDGNYLLKNYREKGQLNFYFFVTLLPRPPPPPPISKGEQSKTKLLMVVEGPACSKKLSEIKNWMVIVYF